MSIRAVTASCQSASVAPAGSSSTSMSRRGGSFGVMAGSGWERGWGQSRVPCRNSADLRDVGTGSLSRRLAGDLVGAGDDGGVALPGGGVAGGGRLPDGAELLPGHGALQLAEGAGAERAPLGGGADAGVEIGAAGRRRERRGAARAGGCGAGGGGPRGTAASAAASEDQRGDHDDNELSLIHISEPTRR